MEAIHEYPSRAISVHCSLRDLDNCDIDRNLFSDAVLRYHIVDHDVRWLSQTPSELMEQTPSPLKRLTLAGRMLLLIHLLLCIGGSALYICDFLPRLPVGSYPILMFVIPVGLVCCFVFLALAWVLERVGVKIYKRDPD